MGFLFGSKKNKATKLLYEGRRCLPAQSLEKFQKAKQLFDELGDNFNSRIAEAEYLKASGKIAKQNGDTQTSIRCFEQALALFSSVRDYDSASKLRGDLSELKMQVGDYGDLIDRLRTLLTSVDFKNIFHNEAERICHALDIRPDTLNRLLGELESEELVRWTGECYRIMTEEVQRIEVRHRHVSGPVEALMCPVCGGKLEGSGPFTKCAYCGANLKIT